MGDAGDERGGTRRHRVARFLLSSRASIRSLGVRDAHGRRPGTASPQSEDSPMSEPRSAQVPSRSERSAPIDPWRGLDPFRSLLDRFFQESPEEGRSLRPLSTPQVDITETADEYRIHAELPGVAKDDVTVELDHGLLTIRGEKKSQRDEKIEKGRRLECSYGAFARSFALPQDADGDRITAKWKDGVLDVAVKRAAASKPKQVAIKS